jgi:hypothetical protein
VTISGTADVFEATVSIRILDATNNTLADTFATATCGTGCRGDYTIDVPFSVNTPQPGVIQVFEVSAKDGRLQFVPCDQREGLAVLVAESHERGGERGTLRDVVGVVASRAGERVRRAEVRMAAAGVVAASPVGELFAGRGQERGECVVSGGHVLEPSPCHREGLGHHVACLLLVGAAHGVAEDATEQLVPELLEPRHSLRVRTPSSHHPGDVSAGRILTSARGGSGRPGPQPCHAVPGRSTVVEGISLRCDVGHRPSVSCSVDSNTCSIRT